MSTPSSGGLREVKLRLGIRRLHLVTGEEMAPSPPWYRCREEVLHTAATLNGAFPTVLHTVEEVELNPGD